MQMLRLGDRPVADRQRAPQSADQALQALRENRTAIALVKNTDSRPSPQGSTSRQLLIYEALRSESAITMQSLAMPKQPKVAH
jgi:hypothetical protein